VHWGNLFGPAEIVALTNLAPPIPAENDWDHPPQYLCLFAWVKDHWVFRQFWKDDWHFEQSVGRVSANDSESRQSSDWTLKERRATHTFYVISHMRLYPSGEHLSWLCDPQTHRFVPTGWRTDVSPSIFGDTITFSGQEKPGYSPLINEIPRFDGSVGPLLARTLEKTSSIAIRANSSPSPPRMIRE
jgi:hypothetical protein